MMRRKALGLLATPPAIIAMFPNIAAAQSPKFFQNPFAINAADPVGYFRQEAPLAGLANNKVEWGSAGWRFASSRNVSQFATSPETYAPLFGGY
jgi:hypothetical protein